MYRLIKCFPMGIGHIARSKQTNAGSSVFHGNSYCFFYFRRDESMSFRILDLSFFLVVATDEQSAVNWNFAIYRSDLFFYNFADPCRTFKIKIIVIHREECIQVPFIPFLTYHLLSVAVWSGEYGSIYFLSFGMYSFGNMINQFGVEIATELFPLFNC